MPTAVAILGNLQTVHWKSIFMSREQEAAVLVVMVVVAYILFICARILIIIVMTQKQAR